MATYPTSINEQKTTMEAQMIHIGMQNSELHIRYT